MSDYALARQEAAEERRLVLGAGGAAEVELSDGSLHAGAHLFLEWDAIEDWLELELGASALDVDGHVELPLELAFKKPFRLAPGIELMPGIGPEVVQVFGAKSGVFVGAEAVLDVMFWPSRRVGFWIEPDYDVVFRDGVSDGVGGTSGLLIGW